MPQVNKPELGKGFWITIGVILALIVAGLVSMIVQKVTAQKRG